MPVSKKTPAKSTAPAKKKLTPIPAYTMPPPRPVMKRNALPFEFEEGSSVYEALDDITLSVEGGKLTRENWVREIFKTTNDFENFLEELSGYDELYRISDRWWYALARLVNTASEEEFSRTEDIAHYIRLAATESGQL